MYRFQAKHNKDQLVYGISVHCKDEFQDLILSFRGSSTVQDWLQNIQVPLVELLLRHDTGSNNAYLIEQRGYHAIEIHVELYNKLTRVLSLAGDAPLKIRVHAGTFLLQYRMTVPPRAISFPIENISPHSPLPCCCGCPRSSPFIYFSCRYARVFIFDQWGKK